MSGSKAGDTWAEAGFSLVELVTSLIVLAFGVVGLATTTLFITRQLTLAEVTTARVTAIQSVMERIRTTPYDSICEGTDTMGAIVVSWSETAHMAQTKAVRIVTMGPGLVGMSEGQGTPMMSSTVVDTIVYRMLRLELAPSGGHLFSLEKGVHDATNETAVFAGVPAADGRAGQSWTNT